MRAVLLLALCCCTSRTAQLPVFSVPTGVQLRAPKTPEARAEPPGADAVFEENAQHWAWDTAGAYLDQLLPRQPRFRADGVHRLFHQTPDLKVLTFRVQRGEWVEYLLVDLPDPARKGRMSRAWGKATKTARYAWEDLDLTGLATRGAEGDRTGASVWLIWDGSGGLIDRTALLEGDPTKVSQETWSEGKVVSTAVRPRPEYRKNFLDNNAY